MKYQNIIAVAFLALLLFWSIGSAEASELRVHFIAVGHGDAIFVELDGNAVALVDAGPASTGEIMLDYLHQQGIHRIPHVFATHDHQDHIGSLPLILDSLQVDTIHVTGMVDTWEPAATLTRYLQTGKWHVDTTDVGDIYARQRDFRIEVLSPLRAETAGREVDCNENSLVLSITHGDIHLLLASDINKVRQDWLLEKSGARLQSQVLKIPHHGSSAGYNEAFIRAVDPKIAIISVGPNDLGYPSDETLQKLKEQIPIVLRTDEQGTIVLHSDGHKVRVETALEVKP
jgi:competence protein ComEC